jgi:hypothetical protein
VDEGGFQKRIFGVNCSEIFVSYWHGNNCDNFMGQKKKINNASGTSNIFGLFMK